MKITFHNDLMSTIITQVEQVYTSRGGRTVPTDKTVTGSQGVELDVVYLYADLADSSGLAQKAEPFDAARVIRMYVNVAAKIIRHHDGHIRSYDGDRVMGIFIGDGKETRAGRAALAISGYVKKMRLWVPSDISSLKSSEWEVNHGVGIDVGKALIVRAGIREYADIVSIGRAPNVAAKLSAIRDGYAIRATHEAYMPMSWDVSYFESYPHDNPTKMWPHREAVTVGGRSIQVWASNWYWNYDGQAGKL